MMISSLNFINIYNLVLGCNFFVLSSLLPRKCERSFSKLKIVKNSLGSCMAQPRFCESILTNTQYELFSFVDYEAVINAFATSPLLGNIFGFLKMKQQIDRNSQAHIKLL